MHYAKWPATCPSSENSMRPLRESLFDYLKAGKTIVEKRVARHSLGIQQSSGNRGLGKAYWLPGVKNPAGRLTEVESESVRLPR